MYHLLLLLTLDLVDGETEMEEENDSLSQHSLLGEEVRKLTNVLALLFCCSAHHVGFPVL